MTENQPRVCLCLFYRPPTGLKKWRTSSSLHLLGKSVSLSRLPFHYRFVAQYITHARINSREIHKTAMHHRHTHIHDLDTLAHCFLMALQSSIPGLMPETFSSFIAVFFFIIYLHVQISWQRCQQYFLCFLLIYTDNAFRLSSTIHTLSIMCAHSPSGSCVASALIKHAHIWVQTWLDLN